MPWALSGCKIADAMSSEQAQRTLETHIWTSPDSEAISGRTRGEEREEEVVVGDQERVLGEAVWRQQTCSKGRGGIRKNLQETRA